VLSTFATQDQKAIETEIMEELEELAETLGEARA